MGGNNDSTTGHLLDYEYSSKHYLTLFSNKVAFSTSFQMLAYLGFVDYFLALIKEVFNAYFTEGLINIA